MKRSLINLTLALLLLGTTMPLMANPESFEDNLPLQNGMRLSFECSFGHFRQKNHFWKVTVTKTTFPKSLAYTWVRTGKAKQTDGSRILTDLQASRNFNPRFKNKELISTDQTAPWVSVRILKEIRTDGAAPHFREGGSGAVNWKATTLKNIEKVIFPVYLNGKPGALHAFRVSRGMIVWNNLQNPLVLEYEPLGIPLVTNVTGWKLTAIDY